MGNRIGAATPALVPHPTRRDTPSLGELLGGQNFKEKTVGQGVLCSDLCSGTFHIFSINELWGITVLKTVLPKLGAADIPILGRVHLTCTAPESRNLFTTASANSSTDDFTTDWGFAKPRMISP